jgi:hypothetical protein
MQYRGTRQVKETTIYRVLGDHTRHVFDHLFQDRFTCTLLGLVVFTNLMIILIPVSLSLFEFSTAKALCQMVSFGLLLGYAALIALLVAKLHKGPAGSKFKNGRLSISQAPRIRNAIVAIQCLLFASLICSTFIMRQQLGLIKLVDPSYYAQKAMSGSGSSQTKPMDILPLLNE